MRKLPDDLLESVSHVAGNLLQVRAVGPFNNEVQQRLATGRLLQRVAAGEAVQACSKAWAKIAAKDDNRLIATLSDLLADASCRCREQVVDALGYLAAGTNHDKNVMEKIWRLLGDADFNSGLADSEDRRRTAFCALVEIGESTDRILAAIPGEDLVTRDRADHHLTE